MPHSTHLAFVRCLPVNIRSHQPFLPSTSRRPALRPALRPPTIASYKPPSDNEPLKPLLNRFLSSRRLSLTFLSLTGLSYIVSLLFLAHRLSCIAPGYQRIVLLALGILLPDFRHVLKSYSEAVQNLHSYKPVFSFRVPKRFEREDTAPEPIQFPAPPPWLADAVNQLHERMRETLDESADRFDAVVTSFSRDVAKPIVQTGTTIQHMTTGTDLTLRKHVLVAAVSITLSLVGYVICAWGEVIIGGVAIMMASLLASAILAAQRHEVLVLINDIRVVLSLIATLLLVASAILPKLAAYLFLLCCVALIMLRYPIDWMRNL